ncbi:acyl-CoA thioesterase [Paenibacillus arenosi]|uniref:Acyl-CoA thioesterase n=1 Tax=Paenibacillus arenosi TaxID=2774142 RepID=A0ABR9AWB7_9BACL|nr:thioesterase family protein [Paenibacillus arenosi]MBD8498176.1 acyl-CoA thioesterase [Paenibacillus arenosi]
MHSYRSFYEGGIPIYKPVTMEVPVRYIECDLMGVAHHCTYLVWFELGRVEIIRVIGGKAFVNKNNFVFPVIDIQCSYKASARFGQTVIIETILKTPDKALLEFEYRILRKYGRELLAEGRSVHTLMNTDGQTIYQLPGTMRERIEQYHNGTLWQKQ